MTTQANIDHDVAPGSLQRCQVCGSSDLVPVIDLGHQPLCDSLLNDAQLGMPERYFPLRLVRCPVCTLCQLDHVVAGEEVYHQNYPYKSGVTRELVEYQHVMAKNLAALHDIGEGKLVVDIGSNDGTLLSGFKTSGALVLGVEPTNIAELAVEAGIPTIHAPFDEKVAQEIVQEHGHADLITATNVFAHMAALGAVTRGMTHLLSPKGTIVIENHYLGAVLERTQFDTIYHEHIRTYTLKSLVTLFAQYGFEVFRADLVSRYGGNIRVHVARAGVRSVESSVGNILRQEEQQGFGGNKIFEDFSRRVVENRNLTMETLYKWNREGLHVVGNSCPGRCSTLINYYGIDRELMPYLAEQPTSLKKGLYLPGKHLPIVDNSILAEEQPDYIVLMAWHYKDAIVKYLRYRGVRSKLVVPLPQFQVLDN